VVLFFSSALPEYRIAWEHVTFIAGLVWIPLAVFVELRRREKSPEVAVEYGRKATIWYGIMIFLALITRVTTDIWIEMRLFHLALAALFAIVGLTIWVVVFFPFKRSR